MSFSKETTPNAIQRAPCDIKREKQNSTCGKGHPSRTDPKSTAPSQISGEDPGTLSGALLYNCIGMSCSNSEVHSDSSVPPHVISI